MVDKKAVHFGSGAIGRGFVGEFLYQSGYKVVFVDVADQIIDALNHTHSYTVTEISSDGSEHHSTVTNFIGINSKTSPDQVVDQISSADIVTCAVGPNILKFIAPLIAKGINARSSTSSSSSRQPLAVIACENAINATDTLADFIRKNLDKSVLSDEESIVRFANSAVDRIVPQQTSTSPTTTTPTSKTSKKAEMSVSLDVRIEKYAEWCVEYPRFGPTPESAPAIEGVHYVKDLSPYIERKLFTVNTGHATAAYLGRLAGYSLIHQAMADSRIRNAVKAALDETASLITAKHDIRPADQARYVENIIARISNPALEDEVVRVGRAPLRKLSRNERLVGPAVQLAERGMSCDRLLTSIEAAFQFVDVADDAESIELGRILRSSLDDPAQVVTNVCGLSKSDVLFDKITRIVEKVQSDVSITSAASGKGRAGQMASGVGKVIMAEM